MNPKDIQKLKKRILQEERRRNNPHRLRNRLLLAAAFIAAAGLYWVLWRVPPEQRVAQEIRQGEILVEKGRYEAALAAFETILRESPGYEDDTALLRAADILDLYLDRPHEAIMKYLLLEKNHPDSRYLFRAQSEVARIYKDEIKDYRRATVAYQKLQDSGLGEGDHIQYEIADCYFRMNNYEQAKIEFENLEKTWPKTSLKAEVRYRLGIIQTLLGKGTEAAKIFNGIAEQFPDSLFAKEARFALAGIYEEREELKTALAILQDLRQQYPDDEALAKRIEQIQKRIEKKKRAT